MFCYYYRRLFNIFNEFANILKNTLLPPVLKSPKKVFIKLKDYNQHTYYNSITDLISLVNKP